jgi:hypothetical protein
MSSVVEVTSDAARIRHEAENHYPLQDDLHCGAGILQMTSLSVPPVTKE